jgi:ABC-type multidrug transport system fused ATPase/permease subunit
MVNATIRENVAFGVPPEAIDESLVAEAIRDANLEPLIGRLPKGLDTEVGEFGTRFSGGQRQRIGIARALYGRPPLLILDEATSDLDTRTEFEIAKAIRQLKGAHTIILVAHRMHLLKDCDRVAFMKEGRIEAVGTFDELVATVPQFRNLATMPDRYGEKGAKTAAGAGPPVQQAAGAEVGTTVR